MDDRRQSGVGHYGCVAAEAARQADRPGANGYGWSSALVRTGVYRDVAGPPAHKPSMIVDHVDQAIEAIMQKEWA